MVIRRAFPSSVTSVIKSPPCPSQATWEAVPVTRLLLAPLLLITVAGCSGDELKLVPVEGHVTLDGQPVADAGVCFEPVDGGPVGSATTDAGGYFSINTANRPGAISGKHYVTLTKQRMLGLNSDGSLGLNGVTVEWIVPQRYTKKATSGLTADVGEQTTFRFDLENR